MFQQCRMLQWSFNLFNFSCDCDLHFRILNIIGSLFPAFRYADFVCYSWHWSLRFLLTKNVLGCFLWIERITLQYCILEDGLKCKFARKEKIWIRSMTLYYIYINTLEKCKLHVIAMPEKGILLWLWSRYELTYYNNYKCIVFIVICKKRYNVRTYFLKKYA